MAQLSSLGYREGFLELFCKSTSRESSESSRSIWFDELRIYLNLSSLPEIDRKSAPGKRMMDLPRRLSTVSTCYFQ